jgi:predicted amidohydrolase
MFELKSQKKIIKDANKLLVGALQFQVDSLNLVRNLEKIEELFAMKEIEDFDLIALPELFSSGFQYRNLEEVLEFNEIFFDKLKAYAQMFKLIISGSMVEEENGKVYNTQFFWSGEGTAKRKYRKIHLFSGMGEKDTFQFGDKTCIWKNGNWEFGAAICYDLRFPELFSQLTRQGVNGFIIPAQWPRKRITHWIALNQARAIESQSVIIACNAVSPEIGGNSLIIDHQGKILAQAEDQEAFIQAELNFADMAKWRQDFPVLKDWHPPWIYGY